MLARAPPYSCERRGIDALHAELTAKKYKYLRPGVEIAPWNAKCMEVIDPFGNRIRFNEDFPKTDKT
jgi:hypothetical protein